MAVTGFAGERIAGAWIAEVQLAVEKVARA
jgi:hypothetical protein